MMNLLATVSVPDNSTYGMPNWAIGIAVFWAVVVVVLHAYAFVKAKNVQRNSPSTGRHVTSH
ncbi:MAG: hypothetical protein ACRENA_02605 [Vulcanimicrobiaceae bacterium]